MTIESVLLHRVVSGEGEPVVLLHPVGLDHSFWGEFAERCATLHRVVAIDLPGHGASPSLVGEGDINAYVDAVVATMDQLNLGAASIVGLSFGGMIAQQLALRHPDRVARLVLGACGGEIPQQAREAIRARGQLAMEGGMEAVVEATLARWFTTSYLDSADAVRVRARLLADRPADWNRAWQAIATHAALDRLPALRIPTLVIVGDQDLGTSLSAATALADAIPGSRLEVAAGAPHMLQLEYGSAYARLVLDFLDGGKTHRETERN